MLVSEDSIQGIISKIETFSKTDKNYIIEGFPKNIQQAQILQKKGIYVKNLLIINIDDVGLRQLIEYKINKLNPNLNQYEKDKLVTIARMEHKLYFF